MRNRNIKRILGLALAAAGIASFCQSALAQNGSYRIAVMPFSVNEYMSRWVKEMQQHPLVKNGTVKLTVLDGTGDGAATVGDAVKPCACGAPLRGCGA